MRVVFLGTGSGNYTRRLYPSVLVEGSEGWVLVDVGPGAHISMSRLGMDPCGICCVFVSHRHVDHSGGLPSLLYEWKARKCSKPLRIYVPDSEQGFFEKLIGLLGPSRPPEYVLLGVSEGMRVKTNGLELEFTGARHSVPTLGLIIRGDRTVYYSGDTAPCRHIRHAAKKADLCIHEATFPTVREKEAHRMGHSTIQDAIDDCIEAKTTALFHLSLESENEAKKLQKEHIMVPADLSLLEI